jgi:hypothetical protein
MRRQANLQVQNEEMGQERRKIRQKKEMVHEEELEKQKIWQKRKIR